MFTYIKANKVNHTHEISPEEDDRWYRVISNEPVKIPGVRPCREITAKAPGGVVRFVYESQEEARIRSAS